MSVEVTRLPTGLTVVTDSMPHLQTASLGIWVGSGSRDEEPNEHGISHLLEHMAFKGTKRRSARQIAEEVEQVGGDLNAATSSETTAYFDTGYWHAGVARVLADRGVPPGKVLLGGFDLVPEVLQQMKAGYVQVQIDQQPYEQGFMPVMEVYLDKKVGLAPADIDTGQGVVTPDQVDAIMELSKQGLR